MSLYWKAYITEVLGCGELFDISVQFTEKPQFAPVIAEAEEQLIAQDEV
jgi:hypothetical protein